MSTNHCSGHFLPGVEVSPEYDSQVGLTPVHLSEDGAVEVLGSVTHASSSTETQGRSESASCLTAGE